MPEVYHDGMVLPQARQGDLTLNQWQKLAHANAMAHGFTEQTVPESCALLHSEVSELFEFYRKGQLRDMSGKLLAGIPFLTNAEEELADIVIRALDIASRMEIDLERAVFLKHSYNMNRPYKHGNKVL